MRPIFASCRTHERVCASEERRTDRGLSLDQTEHTGLAVQDDHTTGALSTRLKRTMEATTRAIGSALSASKRRHTVYVDALTYMPRSKGPVK
jgi:hypothetical protein